jgi:N-acetylglucosaminyl-diphospho-decaprenol L-rhamnosyltransferase
MITVILVVYKSDEKKLNNIIKKIPKHFKIIIVDNSQNYNFNKIKIPKKTVIIRSFNKGNGAGINIGLKTCKTRYAFYIDIDTNFSKDFLNKIVKLSKKIKKNYAVLIPNNGSISKNDEIVEKYSGEGAIMYFDVKILKKLNYFDENFFLYFEETDLFLRCYKKGYKVLFLGKLKFTHSNASSINQNLERIEKIRVWHYMWSMFYFYKKNYSYLYALSKTYKFIIKDLFMFLVYSFSLNYKKKKLRFFRLYGIFSSIFGLKSFLRE